MSSNTGPFAISRSFHVNSKVPGGTHPSHDSVGLGNKQSSTLTTTKEPLCNTKALHKKLRTYHHPKSDVLKLLRPGSTLTHFYRTEGHRVTRDNNLLKPAGSLLSALHTFAKEVHTWAYSVALNEALVFINGDHEFKTNDLQNVNKNHSLQRPSTDRISTWAILVQLDTQAAFLFTTSFM